MSAKLKVSRGGKILGDFTKEEVLEGLSKGTFLPSDYFWNPNNESAGLQQLRQIQGITEHSSPKVQTPTGSTKQRSDNWAYLGLWLFALGCLTLLSGGGIINDFIQLLLPKEWIGCALEIINHGAIDGLLLMVIGWLLFTR